MIKDYKPANKNANILLNTEKAMVDILTVSSPVKATPYCPHCDHTKHFLNNCANFKKLTADQKRAWVKENNRCWRCGRSHQATECSLKIHKLEQAGYATKLDQNAEQNSAYSWYIPHHMVQHNGKNRLVFNCSFQHQSQNLNKLLPLDQYWDHLYSLCY